MFSQLSICLGLGSRSQGPPHWAPCLAKSMLLPLPLPFSLLDPTQDQGIKQPPWPDPTPCHQHEAILRCPLYPVSSRPSLGESAKLRNRHSSHPGAKSVALAVKDTGMYSRRAFCRVIRFAEIFIETPSSPAAKGMA